MSKDMFIDVANICLGIAAIFWLGVALLPYMKVTLQQRWYHFGLQSSLGLGPKILFVRILNNLALAQNSQNALEIQSQEQEVLMKLILIFITLLVSFPSLGSSHVARKPMQTNLIRLYMRMPSEMRMIAGYKEERIKNSSRTTIWLDDLRARLKTTNGKIRL